MCEDPRKKHPGKRRGNGKVCEWVGKELGARERERTERGDV